MEGVKTIGMSLEEGHVPLSNVIISVVSFILSKGVSVGRNIYIDFFFQTSYFDY
jgi:hypothetical protein